MRHAGLKVQTNFLKNELLSDVNPKSVENFISRFHQKPKPKYWNFIRNHPDNPDNVDGERDG